MQSQKKLGWLHMHVYIENKLREAELEQKIRTQQDYATFRIMAKRLESNQLS
jgi:hypothetical protein